METLINQGQYRVNFLDGFASIKNSMTEGYNGVGMSKNDLTLNRSDFNASIGFNLLHYSIDSENELLSCTIKPVILRRGLTLVADQLAANPLDPQDICT